VGVVSLGCGGAQDPYRQKVVGILEFINLSGPEAWGGVKIWGLRWSEASGLSCVAKFHGLCRPCDRGGPSLKKGAERGQDIRGGERGRALTAAPASFLYSAQRNRCGQPWISPRSRSGWHRRGHRPRRPRVL
jgi:hypothetical protein